MYISKFQIVIPAFWALYQPCANNSTGDLIQYILNNKVQIPLLNQDPYNYVTIDFTKTYICGKSSLWSETATCLKLQRCYLLFLQPQFVVTKCINTLLVVTVCCGKVAKLSEVEEMVISSYKQYFIILKFGQFSWFHTHKICCDNNWNCSLGLYQWDHIL